MSGRQPGGWPGVFGRLIGVLPFGKLRANQLLDLVFDLIAFAFVAFVVLKVDLGPAHAVLKVALILVVLGLAWWSVLINSR
jgi:hypothetical protein